MKVILTFRNTFFPNECPKLMSKSIHEGQGGRKQIFYGGATVNSELRIFKKFPKFT